MKILPIVSGIFLLCFLQSCSVESNDNSGEENKGESLLSAEERLEKAVEEAVENKFGRVRKLAPFNSLLHNISGNVVWKQGEEQRVEIRAVPEILAEIVTEVKEGGVLYIGYRTPNFEKGDNKIYVFVTSPTIKAIRLSGSGNLESKNRWRVEDISLALSGTGNISLNLRADKVMTELTGSGNIKLKGRADTQIIEMSGAGQVLAEEMKLDACTVDISGSGSCFVYAREKLTASIRGSGSVLYKGNPEVNKSIEGAGSVSKM